LDLVPEKISARVADRESRRQQGQDGTNDGSISNRGHGVDAGANETDCSVVRRARNPTRDRTRPDFTRPGGFLFAVAAHPQDAWAHWDSNPEPKDYESSALTVEL